MSPYNESYYTQKNYISYLERRERYTRMINELNDRLIKPLALDKFLKHGTIVDYGCGVGFSTKALIEIGYKAIGYDPSVWAVEWGKKNLGLKGTEITDKKNEIPGHCSLMLSFDVFEHMSSDEIADTLAYFSPIYLLVRIPLANTDNGDYVLSVSENDPTHIMRLTRSSWNLLLRECRYEWLYDVNLTMFYDSDGVMCSMYRKYLK